MRNQQKTTLWCRVKNTERFYWGLLLIAFLDLLLIIMGNHMKFYLDECILIGSVLFLYSASARGFNVTAKRLLALGLLMVAWFLFVQLMHLHEGKLMRPLGVFSSVYLFALPFAAIEGKGDECKGLKGYMTVFLFGMLIVLGLTGLLVIGHVPYALEPYVFHYKSGICIVVHPSQLGGLLLVGLGFSLVGLCMAKQTVLKAALGGLAALLYIAVSLTICNAAIWMACLLLGGCIFFAISRGGVLRFFAGIGAVVVTVAVLFGVYEWTLQWHNNMLKTKTAGHLIVSEERATVKEELGDKQPDRFHQTMASTTRPGVDSERLMAIQNDSASFVGTANTLLLTAKAPTVLLQQLKKITTLNGRTMIWGECLDVIKKDCQTLLFGTDYASYYYPKSTGREIAHTHNSWFETLTALGIPGLLVVLSLTVIAVWHVVLLLLGKEYELWKKCIALLVIALLGVGTMEPHLFLGGHFLPGGNNLHPIDFTFFLCLGYMVQWRGEAKARKVLHNQTIPQNI